MGKIYRKKKLDFDRMVYAYLVKRLREPIETSDAYRSGSVDGFGAPRVKDANWAYTPLDRLIFDIKAELGDKVNALTDDYADVNALCLMSGTVDPSKYKDRYDGIIALVEQSAYLPAEYRTDDPYVDPESDLSYDERVSRALTVATYMLFCLKLDRLPYGTEFDSILDATETTFNIRAIGSEEEIRDYLNRSHLINGRDLSNEGYLLAVRIAKWIVAHDLCSTSQDLGNQAQNWRQLSNAG